MMPIEEVVRLGEWSFANLCEEEMTLARIEYLKCL